MGVAMGTPVRIVDLLGGLSRLADLGFGIPAGEAERAAALAAWLSRSLGLPDEGTRAAIFTALLHHVGCTGYAHEAAQAVPDERAMYALTAQTDLADPKDIFRTFIPELTRGHPPLERLRIAIVTLTQGQRIGVESTTAACEVGRDAARRLGLPPAVQASIYRSYEWWNGKGVPDGFVGEDIPMGARVAAVASTASLLDALADRRRVVEVMDSGAGVLFDPDVVDALFTNVDGLLDDLADSDPHEVVLASEPAPVITVLDPHLIDVATVFADLADLKSPFTHGHSREVARLARHAGERLGLGGEDLRTLEVAALLHDVGRVAISSRIWDKPGRLITQEWEQVRLHAYHSERILAGSARLAPLAELAGKHHERCDGSGYHRGSPHTDLPPPACVLAAADIYQAMTQERPHRPAFTAEQAEEQLHSSVRMGLLDGDAVGAVLAAAGHDSEVRRELPAGLSDREAEVLALVAKGRSNREIAEQLSISRRTAEHHVQHIYTKIGSSTRAAAALFAMEHDLMGDGRRSDR
jgi:HD-GYP domain-containing protein (c-di-GMP phosphodiesterase class II)